MLAQERRKRILGILSREGSVRVSYLSREFQVTEPTIRLDLHKLETSGLIVREHGGAYIKSDSAIFNSLQTTWSEQTEQKKAIGRAAASLVHSGDTIIISSGPTTTEMASSLTEHRRLVIVSNALNIAIILGTEPTNDVIVSGGRFKADGMALVGEIAVNLFPRIHADKLFLSPASVDIDAGVGCNTFEDLLIQKAMMDSARQIFLLAESTRLGNKAFTRLSEISEIDILITDEDADQEQIRQLKSTGLKVILAK